MLSEVFIGISSSLEHSNNSLTDFNNIGCTKSLAISLNGTNTKFLNCNLG